MQGGNLLGDSGHGPLESVIDDYVAQTLAPKRRAARGAAWTRGRQ
jgi:hypothetical protein